MADTKLLVPTIEDVEDAIGPLRKWAFNCHAASLALVKSGILGESRVARGTCVGVAGQHSWAVVGMDCYDREATVVDVTLWSYQDPESPDVWIGTLGKGLHRPHGAGNIMQWGCPESGGGDEVKLNWPKPPSKEAAAMLRMFKATAGGPLDRRFWSTLSQAPVEDWPAAEFIEAMDNTPQLRALVPIDRVGMLTSRNPGGLYLPGEER